MATWTLEITVKDLAAKTFSATGMRTDGEDVRTYTVTTRYDTGKTKQENVDELAADLFKLYEEEVAVLTNKAAFVDAFKGDVVTALDGLEV